jgi:hypothetical protein
MISPDSSTAGHLDDPDSTMALLHAALPDVTGVTAAAFDDCDEEEDSEEEIFFGPKSNKELFGRNSKCVEFVVVRTK